MEVTPRSTTTTTPGHPHMPVNGSCKTKRKRKQKHAPSSSLSSDYQKQGKPYRKSKKAKKMLKAKRTRGLLDRISALEGKADHNSLVLPPPPPPPPPVYTDAPLIARLNQIEAELVRVTRFNRLQNKRNNLTVNLFTIILNELSLKLNMKGRVRSIRNDDALPLSTGHICSLKCDDDGGTMESLGGKEDEVSERGDGGGGETTTTTTECWPTPLSLDPATTPPTIEGNNRSSQFSQDEDTKYIRLDAIIDDVATRVLEAAAISLSNQTISSCDDKNLRRIKEIREFKLAEGVPLNGLVSFNKNVSRFNQDAGLACNLSMTALMENGLHVCFGTDAERAAVHYSGMVNGMNMEIDMDALCCDDVSDEHYDSNAAPTPENA